MVYNKQGILELVNEMNDAHFALIDTLPDTIKELIIMAFFGGDAGYRTIPKRIESSRKLASWVATKQKEFHKKPYRSQVPAATISPSAVSENEFDVLDQQENPLSPAYTKKPEVQQQPAKIIQHTKLAPPNTRPPQPSFVGRMMTTIMDYVQTTLARAWRGFVGLFGY